MLTAALELFAVQAPGAVTIGDIADRAGVTPAAVYYHFPSKDHMLRECVRSASEQCVQAVSVVVADLPASGGTSAVVDALLTWLHDHEEGAVVLFVTSVGASVDVEAIRQEFRIALLGVLTDLVHHLRDDATAAEETVCAAGLLSLIEQAARSFVERDDTYRGLGRRDFQREVVDLANRMAAVPG